MLVAASPSTPSTLGDKASTIATIILILGLHRLVLSFAQSYDTVHEFYLHTLLLLILPKLIGSFQNLKPHQRWIAYYGIWLQLMFDTWTVENICFIPFDLTIFMNMESIFQRHLKDITGGQPVPRTVYLSSWVSNIRFENYIAAHRSDENTNNNSNNSNSNEDGGDEQTVSPTTATTTNTTTTTIKVKLGYLLATIVLLINVYLDVNMKYKDYFCRDGPDSNRFYWDPVNNYVTTNPKYSDYCFPEFSTFETAFFHYLPILSRGFPSLRLILTRLSCLLFALAWSTIPTDVVTTAWTQMWNSPSSRLRKIHYIIIMYPIKMAALVLIMLYTPKEREDVAPTNFSPFALSAVRAKYLLLWFIFFRAATKLVFGLGFIWHLYSVRLNAGVDRDCQDQKRACRMEEKEEKKEQLL